MTEKIKTARESGNTLATIILLRASPNATCIVPTQEQKDMYPEDVKDRVFVFKPKPRRKDEISRQETG